MRLFKVILLGCLSLLLIFCDYSYGGKIDTEGIKTYNPLGTKGGPMVFVPEGDFLMGNNFSDNYNIPDWLLSSYLCLKEFETEKPAHKVYLSSYYIDLHEVTNAEYNEFIKDTNRKTIDWKKVLNDWETFKLYLYYRVWFKGLNYPNQPVVGVNWTSANEYCQWAGKRLPTEAEWEKAARGTDARIFPWGNELEFGVANFCDRECVDSHRSYPRCSDRYKKTAPVGQFPRGASPYGALDMSGNVREWVSDWYDPEYYIKAPYKDPENKEPSERKIVRGSSYLDTPDCLRVTTRYYPKIDFRWIELGFRCAKDAE